MVDLHGQYSKIKEDIDNAIQNVVDSSAFINGCEVRAFSESLAKYLSVKHVIPVANGTDALRITLLSLGLKPGDEVITPSFTFVATAEVAASIGCVPVIVDVDKDNFCIDIESVKKVISPKTKAIVPVHLFGQNANMDRLLDIANEHNIYLVEDACQSIDSDYISNNGERKKSGTVGIAGCTSFFPSKNLGCFGDGGAILTDNDDLAQIARSISSHGMKERYHYERIGMNSRLDSIQAAILNVKLKHLPDYTQARQTAAKRYRQRLSDIQEVKLPKIEDWTTHVYHQFTICVDPAKRDLLREELSRAGIPSMIYYPIPLHLQHPYKSECNADCPNSEFLSQSVLSLPMHTELDEEQLDFICNNIIGFFKK